MKFYLLFFINFNIYAKTYFEPYLGVTTSEFSEGITNITGTSNGTNVNSLSSSIIDSPSGINLGIRLYDKYLDQIMLGGDLAIGINSGTPNFFTSNFNTVTLGSYNYTTVSYGLILGWDMPTMLLPRIWAGYYPIDTLGLSQNGSSGSDTYRGSSIKFGVSIDWWIQISLEYAKHTYTSLNGQSFPFRATYNRITMTQEKVYFNEVMLNISYPFDIGN